jgi:hypothetical protein
MPRALALSPLSTTRLLLRRHAVRAGAAGWEVTVATAFTRSVPDPQGFALACQLDKGLPPEVDYMALRRRRMRRPAPARRAARLARFPRGGRIAAMRMRRRSSHPHSRDAAPRGNRADGRAPSLAQRRILRRRSAM